MVQFFIDQLGELLDKVRFVSDGKAADDYGASKPGVGGDDSAVGIIDSGRSLTG